MLKKEDVKLVRPKPGMLLVKRDEQPTTHSGLWIPSRAHASKRSSLATVVASSDEVLQLVKPGERILLASSGGAKIQFGEYEPIKLEAIYPDQIMLSFGTVVAEVEPEHPLKGLAPRDLALDEEEIMSVDEGETKGVF
jgi:co-chaperonin GroES (HSP10)